jgi:hypothetical protein
MDSSFSNSQYDSIAFSMSSDGGATWSAPIQVNQTPTSIPPGDQQAFLPSIAVAADGNVAVTYYDFRSNDANPGLLTDYWLVEGTPGTDLTNPANWRNEARLTNASFDLEKAAIWTGAGFWIGDYEGLAAAGKSFDAFFAATNGNDPGDIYFRDPTADGSTASSVPLGESSPSWAAAGLGIRDALFASANALVSALGGDRAAFTPPAPTIHGGPLRAALLPPTAAMDQSGGQAAGPSIKQLSLAGGTDVLDVVATDEGDADELALVVHAD